MATFQGTSITGDLTSTTASHIQGQSFQGYYAYWRNNLAYNVDFGVRQIGAGAAWWCSAGYNHHGNSYGAGNEVYLVRYSASGTSLYTMHNYTTAAGGSVGWTGHNISQVRCAKTAGSYPGYGGCVVQINGPT